MHWKDKALDHAKKDSPKANDITDEPLKDSFGETMSKGLTLINR